MAVQLGGCIYTNTSWKEPELIILQSLFFPGVSPSFNEVIPICFHHAVICWTNFVHLYQMSSGFVPCKLQDVKGVPESSFKCSKNGTSPSLLLKLTIQKIAATVCGCKFSPEISCSNFQSTYTASRKEVLIFHLVNGKDSTVYCNQVVHFRFEKNISFL